MNWKRALIPALVLLPVLVVFGLGFGKDPHALPFALENAPLPAFELASLDGKSVASSALAGKPMVINFWSTWCVPCKVEHEVLQEGAESWGGQVQFIGVVYQDEEQPARDYLARRGNSFPQLVDPGSKLAIELGVSGVPETFFVDASGVVRFKQIGALTPESLHTGVQRLILGVGSDS